MSSRFFSNPEARAFLQKRVAIFGLIGAILGATALLFRVLMGILFGSLWEQVTDPGERCQNQQRRRPPN